MAVCRFFLQGHCKFGDNCKYEHPGRNTAPRPQNPFAPAQNSTNRRQDAGAGRSGYTRGSSTPPYNLNKAHIHTDLSNERPQWILSSYGPGKDAPIQLFGGDMREQSFEEMRTRHYLAAATGKQQEAAAEAETFVRSAETQIQTTLNDLDGAISYILNGENQHPNRIDVCNAKEKAIPQAQSQNTGSVTSTFGQTRPPPTGFSNPAGQSSFGRPSAPTFGQPSLSGSTPAQNPFAAAPAFGKPTPVSGLSSQAANAPSNSNPFATAAASQSSVNGPAMNPFQQNPVRQSSPFSNNALPPSKDANPFARPNGPASSQSTSAFGQPSFGGTSQTTSSLPNASTPAPNPFGGFGSTSRAPSNPPSAQQNQTPRNLVPNGTTAHAQKDNRGKLRSWNGHPVSYIDEEPCFKDSGGDWTRIWFPDGPPQFNNSAELPDERYDGSIQEQYMYVRDHGIFKNGMMPLVPPRREWCDWNV